MVINSALSQTGDNLVAVVDDGSPEWTVCAPAYQRGLGYLLEQAGYGFSTKFATLAASPTAPGDTQFDTAYPFPADLLHLILVRLNNTPINYDILDGQLVVNAQGGPPPPNPPGIPGVVTIKYVSTDNSDVQLATPTFVLALQTFVMSGIYRGLHEDIASADRLWMAGERFAQEARTRYDQQKPKRAIFNSRITAARWATRPWPPYPSGWGGTGSPR